MLKRLMLKRAAFTLYRRSGLSNAVWRVTDQRLRILAYHGICNDSVVNQVWLPSYFVTGSTFETHLRYLKENATVLKLSDAYIKLKERRLPNRSVVITFDDGYANNLYNAVPLLRQYSLPATIFISTRLVENQELFPFDKLAFLKNRGVFTSDSYTSMPLDLFEHTLDKVWPSVRNYITPEQYQTLRPMTVREVKQLPDDIVELGAHTQSHVILRNESRERRNREIVSSIKQTADWMRAPVRTFSYPNGLSGDFDSNDKAALRSAGVIAAVSMISGLNSAEVDPLELRRLPVSIKHDLPVFIAELTGMRSTMKAFAAHFR